ncbi:MAG: DUF6390 family protein [Candidatus Marsarchaeota archaeon]|nr:DUF6390 family protein [Candidatus Marsarchaeota archaeon]
MQGIELAASFSLPPNQLGLCGPKKTAWGNPRKLAVALKKFRAPYSYLSLIADANGLEPFDYDVVEAFWLGNKLLEGINGEDVAAVIRKCFVAPSFLSQSRASSLIARLPARIYPHHSFHVFYIGSISGVLKRTRAQLDACRVAWGEVKKVKDKSVQVSYRPLVLDGKNKSAGIENKNASLGSPKLADWKFDSSRFSPSSGDLVASHWGALAATISRRQANNLEKYTLLNMELLGQRPDEERG